MIARPARLIGVTVLTLLIVGGAFLLRHYREKLSPPLVVNNASQPPEPQIWVVDDMVYLPIKFPVVPLEDDVDHHKERMAAIHDYRAKLGPSYKVTRVQGMGNGEMVIVTCTCQH
jgi:hypothetical protein